MPVKQKGIDNEAPKERRWEWGRDQDDKPTSVNEARWEADDRPNEYD